MKIFYWVMGTLTALTLLPSLLFILLYAFTGEDRLAERARKLFDMGKMFALLAFNIGIWGNVVAALWGMLFR